MTVYIFVVGDVSACAFHNSQTWFKSTAIPS